MRYIILTFGLLFALAFNVVSGFMNWSFAYSLGQNEMNSHIWGGISIAAEGMKFVLPMVIFWTFRSSKAVSGLAMLLFMVCISWSALSAIGFNAANRMGVGVVEQVESSLLTRNQKALAANDARLKTVRTKLEALDKTEKKRGYLRRSERNNRAALGREQERLGKKSKELSRAIRFSVAEVVKSGASGSQIKILQRLTGWAGVTIIMAISLALMFLVEVGSWLAVPVTLYAFGVRRRDTQPAPSPREVHHHPIRQLPIVAGKKSARLGKMYAPAQDTQENAPKDTQDEKVVDIHKFKDTRKGAHKHTQPKQEHKGERYIDNQSAVTAYINRTPYTCTMTKQAFFAALKCVAKTHPRLKRTRTRNGFVYTLGKNQYRPEELWKDFQDSSQATEKLVIHRR